MVGAMSSRFVVLAMLVACRSADDPLVDAPPSGHDDAPRDGNVHVDDGTPIRQTCTSNFGNALSSNFGRLDGYLVAIVQPMNGACNADQNHVHLQIKMNGDIYDVAVNVGEESGTQDVHSTTLEHGLPGPAWAEGWHTGAALVDYVSMGVHSTDMPLETAAGLASEITTDLATANHISVFATGYGPDGIHLVHRNGHGTDGLIVTEPLSTPSHARLFSFSDQAF